MNAKFFLGAAAAAIAVASAASAQTVPGPYVAVDAGVNFPQDIKSSTSLAPLGAPLNWTWRPQVGLMADGRAGYQFIPHLRAEVEFGYRDGPIHYVGNGNKPPLGTLV